MKLRLNVIAGLLLILAGNAVVNASMISTGPFTGSDSANWGNIGAGLGQCVGTAGTCVNTLTTSDNKLTISFSSGNNGIVSAQSADPGSANFNGSFLPNEYLLNTLDSLAPGTPDSVTISFLHPVSNFGVYVEEFDGGSSAFQASISNTGKSIGSYTTPSGSGLAWVGLADSTGARSITSVTLSTSGADAGNFLLGTAQFDDGITVGIASLTPSPEPGSMLLMAGGLGILAWKARKHVRG